MTVQIVVLSVALFFSARAVIKDLSVGPLRDWR